MKLDTKADSNPHDAPFESLPLNGLWCTVCATPQRESYGGPTCSMGHGGAPGMAPLVPQKTLSIPLPKDHCPHDVSMTEECLDCIAEVEAKPTEDEEVIAQLMQILQGVEKALKPGSGVSVAWSELPALAKLTRKQRSLAQHRLQNAEANLKVFAHVYDQMRIMLVAANPDIVNTPFIQTVDEMRVSIR